ncbi:sulfotransferase 1 family member D1-like [Ptychodera flava]|uniref:sulfotransferase 1 family member D1-like n=1 Tax=Ptychodera flava TaxID=63121 RepID=UPI003969BF1C
MAEHSEQARDARWSTVQYFEHKGFNFSPHFDKQKVENDALSTFQWRNGDVVVSGFPKSGTTWLCYLLRNMADFGIIYSGGRSEALILDWFLMDTHIRTDLRGQVTRQLQEGQLEIVSPRLIKTHLALPIFPLEQAKTKSVKVIHISRNPKDVAASSYHFYQSLFGGFYASSWEKTVDTFLSGRMLYGPWLQHVVQWKKLGPKDNVLQVTYEEMKTDLPLVIHKIGQFLSIQLSNDVVNKIALACSADEMKKCVHKYFIMDKGVLDDESKFIRKGVIGDWKNQFLVAQSERFDEEIERNLQENGIKFQYEPL